MGDTLQFPGVRFFVNTTLAPCFPLEVFGGIGDVAVRPVNPDCSQRLVKNAASRPDKRFANLVFLVVGLFTNEDHDDICYW